MMPHCKTCRFWSDRISAAVGSRVYAYCLMPIGDCTAEVVLQQAERRETDARFMREMAHGVPSTGKIRDYKNAGDAEAAWKNAHGPQPMSLMQWWESDTFKTLNRPIKTVAEYEEWLAEAKAIEAELADAPDDRGRGIALDMIANRLKSFEDDNRYYGRP